MLRRRHKTPKQAPAPREGGTARTLRSRRRAREDAPVPPELRIQADTRAPRTPAKPVAPKPQPMTQPAAQPPKPQPKAEAPAPKPEPRPQPKPEPRPQPRPEAKPHQEPESKREPRPPSKPGRQPHSTPERRPPQKPQPHPRAGSHGAQPVVLVTGFEPFAGDDTNPSWDVCSRLPREIDGLRVEVCRVPCEFRRAIETVAAAIEQHRPSIVLCLGLAAGRTHLGVERIAINVDDARIPDNAGVQPIDQPVAASGPPAYFATVPVKAMVAAMHERGAPAEVSNSAGTFVCNHLMYGVLHFLAASGLPTRAGFIHVPCAEGQALAKRDVPTMSLATMARGIEAAIGAAHAFSEDIAVAGGTLD